jgi:thiamine biosynthesis lipoprotein ApbE
VYALGAPPGREAWTVEVQDPAEGTRVAFALPLRDRALSIAGSSEKFFERDGVRYTHIMDPRTGRPVAGMLGVAVLAGTGTAGDAIDDAVFVLGAEGSRRYLERVPGTEAFLFVPGAGRAWRMVRLRAPGTRASHLIAGRSTTP